MRAPSGTAPPPAALQPAPAAAPEWPKAVGSAAALEAARSSGRSSTGRWLGLFIGVPSSPQSRDARSSEAQEPRCGRRCQGRTLTALLHVVDELLGLTRLHLGAVSSEAHLEHLVVHERRVVPPRLPAEQRRSVPSRTVPVEAAAAVHVRCPPRTARRVAP